MPVDLSRIGIEGMEAADARANNAVARLSTAAQTQKTNIENQIAARDIALDQKAAAVLADIKSGKIKQDVTSLFGDTNDDSSARPLEIVGDVLLSGGAIKRAIDALKEASNIRRDESLNARAEFENAKDQVDTVLKTANAVAQTIGVARNESEWRYGLSQLREHGIMPEEQLSALEGMDYDEDVVAYLNEQAISAYNRAQLQMTSSRDAVNKRQADSRIANSRALTQIAQGRLKLAQEAAARAAKNGKSVNAPTTDQRKAAEAAIVNQVFKGKPPTTADQKAAMAAGVQAVAARAQALVRENKALDYDTALNRAIIESQAAGDWEETTEGALWWKEDKVSFGKGRTPATAITLPQTAEGKPDATKLKKGKFYITAKGTARWNGKAFVAADEN